MDIFLKTCAITMVSVVLLLILDHRDKHIAILLCVAICCIILISAAEFIQPVIRFIRQLQRIAAMDHDLLIILLKTVAVAVVCEISSLICQEAGYGSLGKVLQLIGMITILYFSLPMFTTLIELISDIMSGL